MAEVTGMTPARIKQETIKEIKNATSVFKSEVADVTDVANSAKGVSENTADRVAALESREGLSPESPVDGQTANLISQPGTLTRTAVTTTVESVVDGRYLPNDHTYALIPRLVHHDRDSMVPRPDTEAPVFWLGIPMPVNSRPGDVLFRPPLTEADWSPDWLNLMGWYDPSTLTPGSTVTHVADLSGHENHLSIPGGTGTIKARESASSRSELYFDGNSWISSGILRQGQWTHPTTVWIVATHDDLTDTVMSLFDSASAPVPNKSVVFISNYNRFSAGAGTNLFGAEMVPRGTPTLLMVNFAGNSKSHGELNGEQSFGPTNLGSGMPDSHRLGANATGANPFTGGIGEVIIATGAIKSERDAVTAYLMDKWGIV